LLENAELYQKLVKKRDELEQEITYLTATIKKMQSDQEKLKASINNAIEKEGLYLLNNDLERQEDFKAAKEFNIDYRNNLAFIADKDAKYSASSNFYLKRI
jgi:septal ring factor EnvC (AmiA/AmiB activator)